MKITAHGLTEVATGILVAADVSAERARKVAERLVIANLTGHDSHGIGMVPKYVEGLLTENLNPNADAEIIEDRGPFLLVDGHQGFGQIIAEQAMTFAIERARESHFALLSLRNSFHIGRIGDWAEMAAEAGFISIHYVNVLSTNALVAPFGGSAARFSTNPYCTAVPAGPGRAPFLLDMATSNIAHGKARVAHLSGKTVPEGSLIDHQGRPTQDPGVLFEDPKGALSPFGAHKGFGLAMLGDILGGSFSGGKSPRPDRTKEGVIINNMMAILVDPDVFGGADAFFEDMAGYEEWIKSSPSAPESDGVLIPGEPERRARAERSAHGVDVDPGTWAQLQETAELVGLTKDLKQLAGLST